MLRHKKLQPFFSLKKQELNSRFPRKQQDTPRTNTRKDGTLGKVPLDTKVQLIISFDNGVMKLRLSEGAPITVITSLTEVTPFVTVASGAAEFTIGP